MLPESLLANGRCPSISLCQQSQLFLPNISRFPKALTSRSRFASTTFAERDGRSPPKPLAISKSSTTSPRYNCQNLRQNQISVLRTGASASQRKVGRICGSFQSLHRQECSNFCPPPSKPTAFTDQARLLRDVSSFAGTARKGRAQTCRSTERLPAD
jgi:hypothetical protein